MNKNKNECLIVSFLIFSVVFVGFVFLCTDAEYNYNQQIARGFISKDAVFFYFDDPSYKEAYYSHVRYNLDDSSETVLYESEEKEAVNPNFKLINRIGDNGNTAVETMFSSSEGNYLVSIHSGVLRGVFFRGNIVLPPVISGRFFTEDECLSDRPLAVIGGNYMNLTVKHNGKTYLDYKGRKYEVIGLVGMASDSPIDDVIFVNLGSLSAEEQLDGSYYIDCSKNNKEIYESLLSHSEELFGCGLKTRDIPTAFIDIVSGGMYLKTYLKCFIILLAGFAFINVLIQSIRKDLVKMAVMKILCINALTIFIKTTKRILISFSIGILFGISCDLMIVILGLFSLPLNWILQYLLFSLVISVLLLVIWLVSVAIFELVFNPKGVIQKI